MNSYLSALLLTLYLGELIMSNASDFIDEAQKSFSAINAVTLEGYIDREPVSSEVGKKPFSGFPIMFEESYKKDNKTVTKKMWMKVVCYGNLASIANLFAEKGKRVIVQGRISKSRWKDKSGKMRDDFQVVAEQISFLDHKSEQS